jgi:hypothetical protein
MLSQIGLSTNRVRLPEKIFTETINLFSRLQDVSLRLDCLRLRHISSSRQPEEELFWLGGDGDGAGVAAGAGAGTTSAALALEM